MKLFIFILSLSFSFTSYSIAQQDNTFKEQYEAFKKQKNTEYDDFRQKANKGYVEFMRKAWIWHQSELSISAPLRPDPPLPAPAPPKQAEIQNIPDQLLHFETVITVPPIIEQPTPITPIKENPEDGNEFRFNAYGTVMHVRLNNELKLNLENTSENEVANQWAKLSEPAYNNLLNDCLKLRSQYNLCDWAYLSALEQLTNAFCGKDTSEATLLQGFLFNQSGYKIRLGRSKSNKIYLLVASRHEIYNKEYFNINEEMFYPLHYKEDGLYIYENNFPKEQELSLEVGREQLFYDTPTTLRTLQSKGENGIAVGLTFNKNLIDFYNNYPQSQVNNDGTTKWCFYANTPLSHTVKEKLYPILEAAIKNKTEQEASNILINFVQTALTYGYDEKIWGEDRPFFAEETLFYPYSDCEDRAILFSNLIRDLLHLDTVLLYYPGHLAMAICFHENVGGKALLVNNKKFTYCEPTCSGYAPVGWCPDDLLAIKPTVISY